MQTVMPLGQGHWGVENPRILACKASQSERLTRVTFHSLILTAFNPTIRQKQRRQRDFSHCRRVASFGLAYCPSAYSALNPFITSFRLVGLLKNDLAAFCSDAGLSAFTFFAYPVYVFTPDSSYRRSSLIQ